MCFDRSEMRPSINFDESRLTSKEFPKRCSTRLTLLPHGRTPALQGHLLRPAAGGRHDPNRAASDDAASGQRHATYQSHSTVWPMTSTSFSFKRKLPVGEHGRVEDITPMMLRERSLATHDRPANESESQRTRSRSPGPNTSRLDRSAWRHARFLVTSSSMVSRSMSCPRAFTKSGTLDG